MGKYPVTVGEFGLFVKSERYVTDAERKGHGWVWVGNGAEPKADANWKNSYLRQTPDHPVVLVSWHDAQRFLKWLDGQGDRFQLPAEAQWEYACRAGTGTRFYFGDDPDYRDAPSYAWYEENSGGTTHPVGRKKPNAWNLYDMVGNTKVWVADWYGPYPAADQVDPTGPRTGAGRVRRGACFMNPAEGLRATLRTFNKPSSASFHTGFRVALTIPVGKLQGLPTHRGLVLWLRADKGVVKGADGLVSKWEDLSGKGNHASQAVPAKRPRWGQVGDPRRESLIFDGTSDFLQIPHSDSLDLSTEMTVAAWIWPGEGNRPDAGTMVAKYQWVDGKMLWGARYRRGGEGVTATIYNPADRVVAETPAPPRRWSHFAFVFRPNLMRLYVNGRLDTEKKTPVSRVPSNRTVPVTIGWGLGGRGRNYFKGALDDIRLYDRALTRAEIQAVMKGKSLHGPPVRDGLVAYYPGDGNAQDASGNAHHGKVEGSTWATDRHGTPNGAFLFTGAARQVKIDDHDELDTDEAFTLCAWVMPVGPGRGTNRQILCKYYSGPWGGQPGNGDYLLQLTNERRLRLRIANSDEGWQMEGFLGTTVVPKAKWTHVAGTFDRGKVRLYVNGRLELSELSEKVKCTTRKEYGHDYVSIGNCCGEPRYLFEGAIDDAAIYNRALTQTEIQTVMKARSLYGPPIPDGLVLYYPFDRAGDRAEDRSGKGNHGKVHKAKWTPNGKVGGAYEFDGKTTYIQRDFDERCGLFPKDGPISVVAWFRTSAFSPRVQTVLGTLSPAVGDGYYLNIKTGELGGRLRWLVYPNSHRLSKARVNDGAWHHAVGIWDGETSSLYVDAVLQDSGAAPRPMSFAHRIPFRVGHQYNRNGPNPEYYYFKGTIDEVMVFNRALSAKEVRLLASPARLAAAQRPREDDPPAVEAEKGGREPEAAEDEAEQKAREAVDKEQPPVQEEVPGGEAKDPADGEKP